MLSSGQMVLVKDGKAKASIVLMDQTAESRQAAELLNKFVERISGTQLSLVQPSKAGRNAVFIGGEEAGLTTDGYQIKCQGGALRITSGGGKGTVYGVATLLERYMGVNYWAYKVYDCPRKSTLELPALQLREAPAFRFRQTFSY